jgi:protocatechuate 3,4-dioxygenase beta subunit
MRDLCRTYLCYFWIVLLWIPASGFTQTPSSASLHGTVTDPSGARIPGAMVQVAGPSGDQRKTTDAAGQYAFAGLIPGTYLVRVIA